MPAARDRALLSLALGCGLIGLAALQPAAPANGDDSAFAVAGRRTTTVLAPSRQATHAACVTPQPFAGSPRVTMGAAVAAAISLCAAALQRRTRTALAAYRTRERRWWSIEETRDPTTIPVWQRDYRFAYQVLKRTMVAQRKKGNKVFWDVRVLKSEEKGCQVEMLNSGLIGWCPRQQEGKERLEVGTVVKMECISCPQKRVDSETRSSPWPKSGGSRRAQPYFSHFLWQEQQAAIQKAQSLEAGTIVTGTVFKHVAKGLLIELEGEGSPKGMLDMHDISRKCTPHNYVDKMFPVGTQMKFYVVHADQENGRITLSTKEFEDDEHVGWMLSFPERCFKMSEEAVGRYHQKREAYIAMLQA